ncbi:MAG: hypothetical protein EAZ76_03575 [Nostocales cyanobacterium]|nr:MAG: hypothetical protein EAZ76_03575 [Nostocales cyanobacterium]
MNRLLFTEKRVFTKFTFIIVDTQYVLGNVTNFLPCKLVNIDISVFYFLYITILFFGKGWYKVILPT